MNGLAKAALPFALACLAALAGLVLMNSSADPSDKAQPPELIVVDDTPPRLEDRPDRLDPLPQFDPAPEMSPVSPNGYLARIMLDSPEDVEKALLRAEQLYQSGDAGEDPLAVVLHGPEVQIFLKENYQRYKSIVDLAARLSAFDVLDVKVCETRLGLLGESKQSLPAFIETVPFGPDEVERLIVDEQYVYF